MKRLMCAVTGAAFILMTGCTTPVRVRATGADGTARDIEVRDVSGKPLEVGRSVQEKVDKVVPSLEKEIVGVLKSKVANREYAEKYEIDCNKVVSAAFAEPLTAEEKSVIDQVIRCLVKRHVEDIVYPAWADDLTKKPLSVAKAALEKGDYAGAREGIWSYVPCKVTAVDALARQRLDKYLNGEINIAEWRVTEKTLTERIDALVKAGRYAEAKEAMKAYLPIRTYSMRLTEAPSASQADKEDGEKSLGVVAYNNRLEALKTRLLGDVGKAKKAEDDAKIQAQLDKLAADARGLVKARSFGKAKSLVDGFAALADAEWNKRLTELKAQLLDEIAKAQKADFDVKMQAKLDGLVTEVISLVKAKSFDQARKLIVGFDVVDDAEWKAKAYAARIGLLNVVVNPNQLDWMISDADAKTEAMIRDGKYDQLVAFVKDYPYVHDSFDAMFAAVRSFDGVMKGMKISEDQTSEFLVTLRARIVEEMEKRKGDKLAKMKTNEELEKALSVLGETYLAQYYNEGATNSLTSAVREEILNLASCRRPAMTTWAMNEALKKFLNGKLAKLPSSSDSSAENAVQMIVPSDATLDYDEQIAMAEGAIAAAHFGLEAVMGDYARIMRNLKKGVKPTSEDLQSLLVGSVVLNQQEVFDLAMKQGVDVSKAPRRDLQNRSALLVAIEMGRYQYFEMLNSEKSVKTTDAKGNTPLHYAVARGNMSMVRALSSVVDLKSVNAAGETVLFAAVRRNQLAAARFLIASVGNAEVQKEFVNHRDGSGQAAFALACSSNAHMLLDTLAEAGADYDEANLGLAAKFNCVGAAQWLVEQGLDVNDKRVLDAVKDLKEPNDAVKYLTQEGLKPALADK